MVNCDAQTQQTYRLYQFPSADSKDYDPITIEPKPVYKFVRKFEADECSRDEVTDQQYSLESLASETTSDLNGTRRLIAENN